MNGFLTRLRTMLSGSGTRLRRLVSALGRLRPGATPPSRIPPAPASGEPAGLEPQDPATATGEPGFRDRGRLRRRLRYLRRVRELGFRDLGGLVFDLHRFGRQGDALVAQKLHALSAVDQELRALERALADERPFHELREPGIAACPRCSAIHGSDARFCPACGAGLRGPQAVSEIGDAGGVAPAAAGIASSAAIPAQAPATPASAALAVESAQTQAIPVAERPGPSVPATDEPAQDAPADPGDRGGGTDDASGGTSSTP